jgi:hypothetical protein
MTFVSCFLLAVVSAVVPWINGEVMVLAFAALVAGSRTWSVSRSRPLPAR